MAKKERNRAPEKQPSQLLKPITLPISIAVKSIQFLLFSIVLSTIIDWIGLSMGWWGKDHQLAVVSQDIAYLGNNFTTSVFGIAPDELAIMIGQKIKYWLTYSSNIGGQEYSFMRILKIILVAIEPYYLSFVYSAISVAVRCLIIMLSISFFILVFAVAAVDGLVQRELRKVGGGIEHAQVFHHAKHWVFRIVVIAPMLYLSYPNAINPNWFVLPSAIFFGLTIFISFSTFKKYL